MKKVMITGSAGFIGSHLVEKLYKENYDVTAFIQYNSNSSWGWLEDVDKDILKQIKIISGDVRDYNSIELALNGMDEVFHLAALIAIPYSYDAPNSYVQTNIIGTLNVLQAARKLNLKRVIVTSTSEVYGTAQYIPIDESHPFQGQSPYSASKIGADRIAESFYKSFNVPLTIVRPFNTYGPRQSARAIIPTIITQILSGNQTIKLGSLTPTRDFNFVKDTVNGFYEISKSEKTIGEEINIASQSEISILDLAHKIASITNPNVKIIQDPERIRPENSEVNRLYGSNEKIMKLTQWHQQYSLQDGLKETVAFLKEHLHRYKPDIYNK